MFRVARGCGVALLLLLGPTLVLAPGLHAPVPHAALSGGAGAGAALAAARTSLGTGAGPAHGEALSCASIGSSSFGCVPGNPPPARATVRGSSGWQELCGYDVCAPAARGGAGMTYDPVTGYVVLFGGIVILFTSSGTTFNDTWLFQDGNWTQLHAPGPSPRLGEYMAYDYRDHYIVMFGGGPYLTLNSSLYYSDTWTFQNGTWTQLSLTPSPNARGLGGLVWDPLDGYLLMYGGMTSQYDVHDDTWTFVGGQWHNLSLTVHPPPLLSPAVAFDPAQGYVLLFGGATPSAALQFGDDLEQTWSYVGGVWTNLTATVGSTPPEGRILSAMAYDPVQGYMVLFGGWNTTSEAIFGDTWAYLAGSWTLLFVSPTPASAIIGADLIGTTPDAGLLLFGGIVGSYTSFHATNATWSYGPPPANSTVVASVPTPYNVTFRTAPATCQVRFNGSVEASGEVATVPPGAYNATALPCPGYAFVGWFTQSGVLASPNAPSTSVKVTGDGALTAYYEPVGAAVASHADLGVLSALVGGLLLLGLAAVGLHRRRVRALRRAMDGPTAP